MTHDIDDLIQTLFEYIYKLELRIIDIETREGTNPKVSPTDPDGWYFDH